VGCRLGHPGPTIQVKARALSRGGRRLSGRLLRFARNDKDRVPPPPSKVPMSKLDTLLEELVTANRILAREEVVDSFGHISARHPDRAARFSRAGGRGPDCMGRDAIMESGLDGEPIDARGRKPYLERYIHAAAYEAKPEVQTVVHNHSPSVIPFGVTGTQIRPLLHT